MAVRGVTPILNVSNVLASIAWFETFGWRRGFTWPDNASEPSFGSVCSGKTDIFLCLDSQGARDAKEARFPGDEDTGGVWMSWWVDSPAEVDALHAKAVETGAVVTYAPTDEPWGVREFHLRHPDGHTFRVGASTNDEGAA